MLKIFNKTEPFASKVNFVDTNNVVVGYDMSGHCCEIYGWFIYYKPVLDFRENKIKKGTIELKNYYFDVNYFGEYKGIVPYEEVNMVIFRLNAKTKSYLYLHLYNCHNGYYSHGFELKVDGKIKRNGGL